MEEIRIWLERFPEWINFHLFIWTPEQRSILDALEGLDAKPNVQIEFSDALSPRNRRIVLPAVFLLRKKIADYQPDLVLSTLFWSDVISALAIKSLALFRSQKSIPHLVHVAAHHIPPAWQNKIVGKFYFRLARYAFATCSKVIVISRKMREEMIADRIISRKTRSAVIHISVPGADSLGSGIVSPPRDDEDMVFGVVSRLDQWKGVDLIIRAVSQLAQGGARLKLRIWGDGPYTKELKALADELGLSGKVVFFEGWVDAPAKAYQQIHCLLMASCSEGTPRTILEAAVQGVPTISSNVGGVAETMEHEVTGWLLERRDVKSVKQRMSDVLSHPESLREAGKAAKAFVKDNFSVDREVKQLIALFKEVSGRND